MLESKDNIIQRYVNDSEWSGNNNSKKCENLQDLQSWLVMRKCKFQWRRNLHESQNDDRTGKTVIETLSNQRDINEWMP